MVGLLALFGIIGVAAIKNIGGMRSVVREGVAMDTVVRITAYAPKRALSAEALDAVADGAFDLLRELEGRLSMHSVDSAVALLNRQAGGKPVEVTPDVYRVLETSQLIAAITGGAFDPTIGVVTDLWRLPDGKRRVPDAQTLQRAMTLVGPRILELTPPASARLAKKGAKLDLGGVGKGYASGRLAEYLGQKGIYSALVDLGGNVVAVGTRPDGKPWRIGIQTPHKKRGQALCAIEVNNRAVITAGVYERAWEIDGTTYTHIFDPHTGSPIAGDLRSATVVCDDPTDGDALSTAFMVMGEKRALGLLRILPGIEAIFVSETAEGREVIATAGLRGALELLDKDYVLRFADVR